MSFLSLVFGTLQGEGLYKKGMSTDEAIEIFKKLKGDSKEFPDKPKMEQETNSEDYEMAIKYGYDNAKDLGVADASLGKPLKSKEDFERSMREKLSDVEEAGVDVDNLDLYSKYKKSYKDYVPSNNANSAEKPNSQINKL